MSIINRYILRLMAGTYGSVVAIVLLVLTIENLPRLLAFLQNVKSPATLILQFILSLAPEYIGLGLIIALFLGIAQGFRQLAIRGELDPLAAAGCSSARLLRAPLLLGLVTAALLIGVRGYVQPLGERNLDRLGEGVRDGDYGLPFRAREIFTPDGRTAFTVDHIDHRTGQLFGVLVQTDDMLATAARGRLRYDARGQTVLDMEQGTLVETTVHHPSRPSTFHTLTVALATPHIPPHPKSLRDKLDRVTLGGLLGIHADRRLPVPVRDAALAAASARMASAAFCLILPLFALALGPPPRRSRSIIGIAIGLLLVILFIRMSAYVEDLFAAHAVVAFAGLLAVWSGLAVALLRLTDRHGHGAIDAACLRAAQAIRGRIRPFLPEPAARPTQGPAVALPPVPLRHFHDKHQDRGRFMPATQGYHEQSLT